MRSQDPPIHWLIDKLARIGDLDAEDRLRLDELTPRLENVPRWRHLVNEGEHPEQCCLLVDGFACRYKETPTGARQIVSFHVRGDLLDIQHLLLNTADHSVQAITDATVAWIPKGELLRLSWERPNIGRALWRDSLIDASIFREWVLNVGRRDAKSRISHMICEFVARCAAAGLGTADGFRLPMTQEQIADATGLTTVHVNRTLRAIDEAGAIDRSGKQFRIIDWPLLCRIGDFDPRYLHAAA